MLEALIAVVPAVNAALITVLLPPLSFIELCLGAGTNVRAKTKQVYSIRFSTRP